MTGSPSRSPESDWIIPPKAPQLSVTQRITLLEQAKDLRSNAKARLDLAQLYLSVARADDAADILGDDMADSQQEFRRRMALANIWLIRGRPDIAEVVLREIGRQPVNPTDLSKMHGLMGKVLMHQNQTAEARAELLSALSINPSNSYAYSRFGDLEIAEGNFHAVLEQATEEKYLRYPSSGLLSARLRALFSSDRQSEALHLSGCEAGIYKQNLECPQGWLNIKDFNTELAAELERHPDAYHPVSTGTGTERLRSNGLHFADAPASAALSTAIRAHINAYVASLDNSALWMKGQPPLAKINFWSMRTRREGFDSWHYHANGWLSGVYYVQSAREDGNAMEGEMEGSIGFSLVGEDDHLEFNIAPKPGEIILFPSQFLHRTFATKSDSWRISVAFDVVTN